MRSGTSIDILLCIIVQQPAVLAGCQVCSDQAVRHSHDTDAGYIILQVFKAVKGDIGTRKQDRVVRLDLDPQGRVPQSCMLDLERQLIDAFKACFSARQAAYDDEVPPPPLSV